MTPAGPQTDTPGTHALGKVAPGTAAPSTVASDTHASDTHAPASALRIHRPAVSHSLRAAGYTHLLVLAGYLLATLLFTWPLARNLTTAIPGDSFDGWQNYWNQWWIKVALVDRLTFPLHTDILYAPTGVNLYFHTLNPFNGLVTLPIQLTGGLILAYNAVVFLSFVLAGYGMFLLATFVLRGVARQATENGPLRRRFIAHAAFLGGLVYTLSPLHMAHLLGHMQVISLQWIPFYVLYLLRALGQSQAARSAAPNGAQAPDATKPAAAQHGGARRRRGRQPWVRSSLLAGLFLILNGLCDWYFVLYLLLFTGLAVAWQWGTQVWALRNRRAGVGSTAGNTAAANTAGVGWAVGTSLWQALRPPLVAGSVFVVGLSFWLLPMMLEARTFQFMVRPPADLYILSASVMDFFVPNRLHTLFRPGSFEWIGNQIAPVSERTISIGYVALGLALVAGGAAVKTAGRSVAFWLVAALFFFMLALGPQWQWGNITLDGIPQAVLAGEEVQSYTPYTLLNQLVPFMRISRSVSRFALMVQVSMSVLSAIGLCVVLGFLARRQAGEPYAGEPHTRALNTMAPHAETLHAETLHAETLHAETLHAETLHTGEPHAAAPGESPPRAAHGANHSRTPWFAYGAGAAAILLLLAEYWVAPYPLSPPDTPPYYAQLAADPDPRAVLNLPMNYDRPGYLLYQTVHQKPLTVAYISRDDPRTLTERTPLLQHFRHLGDDIIAGDPAAVAQTVLADLDVGTVVLDRYKMPGGLEREYTEMLAQRVFGGQAPLYADERITVYRVASSLEGGAEPYLRLGPRNWGPRTINAAGAPQRALGGGPALVEVLHATTPAQVTIRYRTEGEGAGARVLPLGGDAIERALPPAPHGGEVTFTVLPPVTTAGVLGQAGLLLEPTTTGTVYIEQLRLEDQQ